MSEHVQVQPKKTGTLLNTRQVSELTGIPPKTIRRWVSLGDFPTPAPASRSKYYRWHKSSIQSWLDRQKK